jgi:hypothetical protein
MMDKQIDTALMKNETRTSLRLVRGRRAPQRISTYADTSNIRIHLDNGFAARDRASRIALVAVYCAAAVAHSCKAHVMEDEVVKGRYHLRAAAESL